MSQLCRVNQDPVEISGLLGVIEMKGLTLYRAREMRGATPISLRCAQDLVRTSIRLAWRKSWLKTTAIREITSRVGLNECSKRIYRYECLKKFFIVSMLK